MGRVVWVEMALGVAAAKGEAVAQVKEGVVYGWSWSRRRWRWGGR